MDSSLKWEPGFGPLLAARVTWALPLTALCFYVSQPSFALPNLEVDFSAGLATSQATAPTLTARVGVTPWKYLTLSLRGLAVVGEEGKWVGGGRHGGSGYTGEALFGELRFHTGTTWRVVQPFLALGLGFGQLGSSNGDWDEAYPTTGRTSHYEQAMFGTRFFFSPTYFLSLETGVNRWNDLSQKQPSYQPPYNAPHESVPVRPLYGVLLLLSFGFQFGMGD